jgi:hypothetical protein
MLVLAYIETEELIIGDLDEDKNLILNCVAIESVEEDGKDGKVGVEMTTLFAPFSDGFVDMDSDLIIYKTDKIKPEIVNCYREMVKTLNTNQNNSSLIDIKSRKNAKRDN